MKLLITLTLTLTTLFSAVYLRVVYDFDEASLPAPITDVDYYDNGQPSAERVELGRMLFFDKILSGNKNISCATCHHPELASADGVALAFGEGPQGLGPDRISGATKETAVHERVPRNAPALFNLGAREFTRLFHDGRVEQDTAGYYEGGFITPAKWKLPTGLANLLAAQAMFPVTSPTEMAGQKGENPVADARSLNNAAGPGGVWELLAERLQEIPAYQELFMAAFPDIVQSKEDISMVLAANAIAAFEATGFRADKSPFDSFLREGAPLQPAAQRGMALFYGKANCASCHSGPFQTDHDFHAIAMPQIGPGKSDGRNADYWRETGLKAFPEDFGRARVTVRDEDAYKFKTPSLRNVALTGPWGHAGAFSSLEAVVRHHLNPVESLRNYSIENEQLLPFEFALETTANGPRLEDEWVTNNRLNDFLKRDSWVQQHPELRNKIEQANELQPIDLADREVDDLLAFLESLTDPTTLDLSHLVPESVPSGLPVED